jgi:hypothetical protein
VLCSVAQDNLLVIKCTTNVSSSQPHTALYCAILYCFPSRNIGCENFRICFFSSFDCAYISRDVITNRIDDSCPCLLSQITVSQPHPFCPVLLVLYQVRFSAPSLLSVLVYFFNLSDLSFPSLLSSTISDMKGPYGKEIAAVEVLGGGVRMQIVQQAVISVMGEVINNE